MANLNKVNEEKMEEILDEILQENISVETFQEVAARSLETAEYDKVNQLLLQHYNKKVGYNFQDAVRQELKLMVNEKMLSKLEKTDDLDKAREEQANEIGNEENIDKDTLEKATKSMNEKNKENQKRTQEMDFRAELMKQVYIEEFKKYSNMLYKMKERQAYNRELTVGDKEGTELVLYEKYLITLQANYKGYAGLKKLDEKDLNEVEEIKKLKEKAGYDLGKTEEYIDSKVNKRLNNVKELYQKRQKIARKLSEITDDKILQQNPTEFKKQMDYYQEEYRKLTYEMRIQDPTLETYEQMIAMEQENKEFSQRENGVNSELGFASGYSDKQKDIDIKMHNKNIESKVGKMGYKDDVAVKNATRDLIKEAAVRLEQTEDYAKVEEYLQSAEDMLGIKDNENKEAEGKQEKVSNQKPDKYMDKNSRKTTDEVIQEEKNAKDPSNYEDPYSLRKECDDTTIEGKKLDKKLELKERLRKVQGKYNEIYGNQELDKDENVRVRG